MKTLKFAMIATLAALPLLGSPAPAGAQARVPCIATETMRERLHDQYGEQPVSVGLGSNGAVFEIYASANGTFSIVMSMANGFSCMMASGNNWEILDADPSEVAERSKS